MKIIEDLQLKTNEIDQIVNSTILSDNPGTIVITDGIIDLEKYQDARFKILWILKEPYCEGDGTGGGWDLKNDIRLKKTIYDFGKSKRTFKPMTYIAWGIFNNFCLYENMDDVEDDPSMLNALKSIAYINVKKLPGFTTSQSSVIEAAYREYKDILHKQIEDYAPDIIIGGSTLYNFFQQFDFTRDDLKEKGSINYIAKNNKLYIEAYHPATTGVSIREYCNDIIETVKEWVDNRRKFDS